MNVTIDDLCTITQDVLSALTGLAPVQRPTPTQSHAHWLESRIQIHGRWSGELAISCDPQLAASVASAFFGQPVPLDRVDDTSAALLELANILAGHINALMIVPSRITLPRLSEPSTKSSSPTESRSLDLIAAFECGGHSLVVMLSQISVSGAEI